MIRLAPVKFTGQKAPAVPVSSSSSAAMLEAALLARLRAGIKGRG